MTKKSFKILQNPNSIHPPYACKLDLHEKCISSEQAESPNKISNLRSMDCLTKLVCGVSAFR